MKRPPESFISDYEVFRERMEWVDAGGSAEDVVRGQSVYTEMRNFLDRWQGRTGVAELDTALADMRPAVENIGHALEIEYLKALRDLLEKRHTVLIEPTIFEAGVAFLGLMKHAPEALRPGLEKIFRESMSYDFDAERFYRENEKDLEEYTAEYNQAFAIMEVTWPDHFTAETCARLANAPIEEINSWKAEVSVRLGKAN